MTTQKVRIDRDKCQGHGRCMAFAPEVFGSDELGYAILKPGRGWVNEEYSTAIENAVSNCPEGAIYLEDIATSTQNNTEGEMP